MSKSGCGGIFGEDKGWCWLLEKPWGLDRGPGGGDFRIDGNELLGISKNKYFHIMGEEIIHQTTNGVSVPRVTHGLVGGWGAAQRGDVGKGARGPEDPFEQRGVQPPRWAQRSREYSESTSP